MSRYYRPNQPFRLELMEELENFEILTKNEFDEPCQLIRQLITDEEFLKETYYRKNGTAPDFPRYNYAHYALNRKGEVIDIFMYNRNFDGMLLGTIEFELGVEFFSEEDDEYEYTIQLQQYSYTGRGAARTYTRTGHSQQRIWVSERDEVIDAVRLLPGDVM